MHDIARALLNFYSRLPHDFVERARYKQFRVLLAMSNAIKGRQTTCSVVTNSKFLPRNRPEFPPNDQNPKLFGRNLLFVTTVPHSRYSTRVVMYIKRFCKARPRFFIICYYYTQLRALVQYRPFFLHTSPFLKV